MKVNKTSMNDYCQVRESKERMLFISVSDMICSNTFRIQDVSLHFNMWCDVMRNDTLIVLAQKCKTGEREEGTHCFC